MYRIIDEVEFELNTICQSFCPTCIRYIVGPDEDGNEVLYKNPGVIYNQVVELSVIEKLLASPLLRQDRLMVNMIGTAGEPVAHPQFIEIVKLIRQHIQQPIFNIHTNGGVKNESFFRSLATAMRSDKVVEGWSAKGHSLGRVCFSFDGVDQESNEKYRIGVDWDRAMKNALAYIDQGGYATWQFVIFDHNRHLLDKAKQMAKDLGFAEFESRENVSPDGIDYATRAANRKIDIKTEPKTFGKPEGWQFPMPEWDYIDDQCFSKNGIFVAPDGKIWPCCMMPSIKADVNLKTMFNDAAMVDQYGSEWNDLNTYTLDQVMKHPWWQQLKRWTTMEDKPCDLCIVECGASKDNRSRSDINEQNERLGD